MAIAGLPQDLTTKKISSFARKDSTAKNKILSNSSNYGPKIMERKRKKKLKR